MSDDEEYSSEASDCSYISEISSELSDVCFENSTSAYNHEPEYSEAELKKIPIVDEISDKSDDDLDSSRLENLHWCRCKSHCVILNTLVECKCCREYDNLLGTKLDGIECIIQHPKFPDVCLNETVLETAFILHQRRNKKFKQLDKMYNKYVKLLF